MSVLVPVALDSERGIAWWVADSNSLKLFLGYDGVVEGLHAGGVFSAVLAFDTAADVDHVRLMLPDDRGDFLLSAVDGQPPGVSVSRRKDYGPP